MTNVTIGTATGAASSKTQSLAAPVRTTRFQSGETVAMAADAVRELLGVATVRQADLRGTYRARHGERFVLELSPGVVGMRRTMAMYEKDAGRWRERDSEPVLFGLERDVEDDTSCADGGDGRRSVIAEWSRASRARFYKRMGQLDYTPWQDARLAMVTLTLPDKWQRLAPRGADFKEMVKRLRKRWEAATGQPLYAVWKLEFQRRGAPHLHMLCEVPDEIAGEFAPTWIGRTWVEVSGASGRDRERMLKAHLPSHKRPVGVCDFSANATDAKRVAVYFGKHASKAGDGKEYQHRVPDEWQEPGAGPGRFWGYWRLQPAVVEVDVDCDTWFRMRRILAHVDRARQADQALRVRASLRLRHEGLRRESLQRLNVRKSRRYTGFGGGWTLTPDALMTAYDMARAVAPPLG